MSDPTNDKWKDKYLHILDQQEALEQAHNEQLQLLRRALVRVSVAAEGQQSELDSALEVLRSSVRAEQDGQLADTLRGLDKVLLEFDTTREQSADEMRKTMQSLVAPLLARDPPRPVKKQLRSLAQEVSRQQDLLQNYPHLLRQIATLQAQVLSEASTENGESGGFLSRLMGREKSADAIEHDASEDDGQLPTSGKADRVLFELNPNASLRDSETVSENLRKIITDLLQSVEAQALQPERVNTLQERLKAGLRNADLIPVLEEVRDLVMAAYMAATRTFAAYLNNVNLELAEIYAALDGARASGDDLQSASQTMHEDMLAEFVRLETQTRDATDLNELKDQVQSRLGSIRAALDSYRQRSDEAAPMLSQLGVLAQKLRDLESEAQKNKQVLEEQRAKALCDPLTGVPNREAYNERIELEAQRFRRYGNPLVLAVCDLDYFKNINDTLGHQAGDRVLKVLSQAISKRLREVDFFGRYGGEEFVVIMPETTAEQAFKVLDQIRAAIASTGFSFKGSPVKVSVSMGIAEFRPEDTEAEVFARADRALYDAKAEGRNQCKLG
ncbi:GGDEF domain-containing protein [Gilvimarinus xylanilyticus]|uniref:diguanylate cyclase n=1 Tax=Gilvimarinus xylanilyticus TaxID=2944139 RepID=A0A9X2I708_9GAMM|nr:GGDEF domain-containing protein [Gilvimarinus xylanilyticus]MCP8900017.1 GGDEF domain-containing protein [Gilvimarinus xylanilyticus]